jgi:hypothetical protein
MQLSAERSNTTERGALERNRARSVRPKSKRFLNAPAVNLPGWLRGFRQAESVWVQI